MTAPSARAPRTPRPQRRRSGRSSAPPPVRVRAAVRSARMGMPAEKSLNFGPSARRLLRRMRPERLWLAGVIALGSISVLFSVLGPEDPRRRHQHHLRWHHFQAVAGRNHAGSRRSTGARAAGNDTFADMLAAMSITPGQGIDFAALGRTLLFGAGAVRARVGLRLPAGLHPQRRRAAHDLQAARGESRTSSTGCRCPTSTSTSGVRCSAGSPTTSTTSRSPCSRPCPSR